MVDALPVSISPQTAAHSAGKVLTGPVELAGMVTVDVETDISVVVLVKVEVLTVVIVFVIVASKDEYDRTPAEITMAAMTIAIAILL
jgi:hypothetical protein